MATDRPLREALARRASVVVSTVVTSTTLRDVRRAAGESLRRLRGRPHEVTYFHQVDDPYSHLAAQVIGRLVDRYDVVVTPYLVGPPADDAAPERELLVAHARRDAAAVAPAYGLAFPDVETQPDPELLRLAARLLVGAGREAFIARAADVGRALWNGDAATLRAMASGLPPASESATREAIAAGTGLRRRLGHYLGATFHYGGEWYWGVDRLHHLEARLRALGAAHGRDARPIVAPPAPATAAGDRAGGLVLEFFVSLRSPYSYIAMERVFALTARRGVELRIRPVLPMVMRGLPVPLAKRLYILRDAKREADAVGVPFGRICDPVGAPIERAFALYPWARTHGRAAEYLLAFCRGAMAEGVDLGTESGLRRVVERAGLSWTEAQAHREDERWRAELEANRRAMFEAGLWGVPSFRLTGPGDRPVHAWGQDRIWLVEQEIVRRGAGSATRSPLRP